MTKVAVLQPSYLPWQGVMALIDRVDTYVFYDDVQFEAQSWQQRNRIKTQSGVQWLTVPVNRNFGQKISEVEINYNNEWRKKHIETIKQAYAHAPHFDQYEYFWNDLYCTRFVYLNDFNQYLTRMLAEGLSCNLPRFVKSSDYTTEGVKTDKLISLLTQLEVTEYISGVAAKAYIQEDKFRKAGIKLTWFDYTPLAYPQLHGDFVNYLSVIDLLFNVGDAAIEFIRRGNVRE